jgi:hypothetical protein
MKRYFVLLALAMSINCSASEPSYVFVEHDNDELVALYAKLSQDLYVKHAKKSRSRVKKNQKRIIPAKRSSYDLFGLTHQEVTQ